MKAIKNKNKLGIFAYCKVYCCNFKSRSKGMCWKHYIKHIRATNTNYNKRANKTQKIWNTANKEKMKKWYKSYYEANKEKILKKSQDWYLKNKARKYQKQKELRNKKYKTDSEFRKKYLEISKTWRNKNKYHERPERKQKAAAWREANREKCREMCRSHYVRNKKYYTAKVAKRKAAKLKRTPKWANLQAIQVIYDNCPPGYHVDHIIPLQGHNVSGLHVEYNLQYLPASENKAKGNRMPYEANRFK